MGETRKSAWPPNVRLWLRVSSEWTLLHIGASSFDFRAIRKKGNPKWIPHTLLIGIANIVPILQVNSILCDWHSQSQELALFYGLAKQSEFFFCISKAPIAQPLTSHDWSPNNLVLFLSYFFVDPTGKSKSVTSWFPFSIHILTSSERYAFLRWYCLGGDGGVVCVGRRGVSIMLVSGLPAISVSAGRIGKREWQQWDDRAILSRFMVYCFLFLDVVLSFF